jgi:hypothetical protein
VNCHLDHPSFLLAGVSPVLAETPVELEVGDRPTVNVRQQESWVELERRYLVTPARGRACETTSTGASSSA